MQHMVQTPTTWQLQVIYSAILSLAVAQNRPAAEKHKTLDPNWMGGGMHLHSHLHTGNDEPDWVKQLVQFTNSVSSSYHHHWLLLQSTSLLHIAFT